MGHSYHVVRLFYKLALRDNVEKCIICSDSTLPLFKFDLVYKNIMIDNKSIIDYYNPSSRMLRRFY